jgi:uncharacterized protein (DUF1015 family)
VVEHRCLGGARGASVVVRADGVQELGANSGLEWCGALFDQAQPKMDVAEQPTLIGRSEDRSPGQLDRSAHVVEQRGRYEEVAPEPRVELSNLATDRRDTDRVLEQPARVAVMALGRRGQRAEARPQLGIADEPAHGGLQPRVRDLAGEKLEEALQLVPVSPKAGRKSRGIEILGGLERPNLELQPVAKAIDSPKHADRVPLVEAAVEQIDVAPNAGLDPAARIDELESQVRRPGTRPPPLLLRNRVDTLDDTVVLELGDRRHDPSLGPETDGTVRSMPEIKPFRALRYGTEQAGPLEDLVAPPYDVIGPAEREEYLARSPYNVVHLTLPDSEEEAGRSLRSWRESGVLATEEPAFWALSQEYVGPDGVARTRTGVVVSLGVEPYENGTVLPHERTHSGPKEGRLRLLRATQTQLEPIFLLYEGPAPFTVPEREPDLGVGGARLWRLDDDHIGEAFADRRLLIADGHHRYETALAYHEEVGTPETGYMMAVLVSLEDPGLTIFPTHRVFERPPPRDLLAGERREDPESALHELARLERGRAAVVVYDGTTTELAVDGAGELDVQLVDRLGQDGLSYTADWREAVRAVDEGEAAVAVLMRPTRIEDVFEVAARGETMPQKSTYFYPKLVSGLLFHPLGA